MATRQEPDESHMLWVPPFTASLRQLVTLSAPMVPSQASTMWLWTRQGKGSSSGAMSLTRYLMCRIDGQSLVTPWVLMVSWWSVDGVLMVYWWWWDWWWRYGWMLDNYSTGVWLMMIFRSWWFSSVDKYSRVSQSHNYSSEWLMMHFVAMVDDGLRFMVDCLIAVLGDSDSLLLISWCMMILAITRRSQRQQTARMVCRWETWGCFFRIWHHRASTWKGYVSLF